MSCSRQFVVSEGLSAACRSRLLSATRGASARCDPVAWELCARAEGRDWVSWDVSASPVRPPREGRPCADLGASDQFVAVPAHGRDISPDLPKSARRISTVDTFDKVGTQALASVR